MLKYIVLSGIVMIALGHIWCGHLALQKQGYWRWALWDIWGFIITDWREARRPCLLMMAGLLTVLLGSLFMYWPIETWLKVLMPR